MRLWATLAIFVSCAMVSGAEQGPAEKAIAKAIAGLEADKDKVTDPIEQSRIDKAIRELEALIEDPDAPDEKAPATDKVTVALKRKLAGKLVWKEKTGELTLAYDFAAKNQLVDFEVGEKRVLVVKKALGVEAGDELRHIAKFKTFTVTVVMGLKSMNGPGVGSSNGAWFTTGGAGHDAIIALSPEGPRNFKVVPDRFRKGNIPVVFNVTSQKISAKYAGEVVTVPTTRANDVHQLVLRGGSDGCGFANLVITGIPDPKWLKEMTEGE